VSQLPAYITFIRHAQTAGNAAGLWQGSTDTGFTEAGKTQLRRLGARFSSREPAVVVSSPLERAAATAAVLASGPELDERWREPNVGQWEGLGFDEIRRRWPDDLDAMLRGEDVAIGGGERLSDVETRVHEALADLVARLDDGDEAIVVSHGLALLTLTATLLETRRPSPIVLMENTGVTTFAFSDEGHALVGYNDVSHLDTPIDASDAMPRGRVRREGTHVIFIRHGETDANVQRRWQGHGDWPLNDVGQRQARDLAPTTPLVDALYASPLMRAKDTALAVGEHQGHTVEFDHRFKEIGFGSWENLTREEIEALDPGSFGRLSAGEDFVRGGTGETFGGVQDRMAEAVDSVVASHPGGTVGVVSHGGATRAYLLRVLGVPFAERRRVMTLRNTARARFVFGRRGPTLAEWNTAPHLDAGDPAAVSSRS
jgi:broad specificity phosphatase PhoE